MLSFTFNMYQSLETYAKRNILPLPADWPGFYYPRTLIAQGREKRISNIVPEEGPFHVYVNATEDVVLIFKFFFIEMYKFVLEEFFRKSQYLSVVPCASQLPC